MIRKPLIRTPVEAPPPLIDVILQLNEMFANEELTLGANTVDSDSYVDGSIDPEHFAAGAVETAALGDGSVTTPKLADDAVTAAKIADDAVVTAGILDANVTTAKLAAGAVDGDKLANNAVGAEHLDETDDFIVNALTLDASGAAVLAVDRGLVATGAYTEYLSAATARARCGLEGNSQHYFIKVSSNDFSSEFDAVEVDNGNGHVGVLSAPSASYSLIVGGGAQFNVADPSTDQAWNVIDSGASGVTNVIGYTVGEAVLIGTGGADVQARGANFRPSTDNAQDLGASGQRWAEVFAATGTINTSDERWKLDIDDCDLGLRFIKSLRPIRYRMKEGRRVTVGVDDDDNEITEPREGARTHYGLSAQNVRLVMAAEGKDENDFAGWTLDDKNDPDSRQGLRLTEFIAPMMMAIKELSERVEELEGKLDHAV